MERIHHRHRTVDSAIEMSDDDCNRGVKMNTENKQSMEKDFPAGLSDEINQFVTNARPSCSSRIKMNPRPRLKATKSFPPYSQCIGGLGEDREWDNMIAQCSSNRHEKEDKKELVPETERKDDFEFSARCARETMKEKWRRREGLGASYEVDSRRWECRGKMDEESEEEREHVKRERDMEGKGRWRHCRGRKSSRDIKRKDDVESSSPKSAVEGETGEGGETSKDGLLTEGPASHQWPIPHPILSKLLHSSSTSSNCSSMSLSSAESDEVFSDKEDAVSKRKTFRKCRSWKTFLTMIHWPLPQRSSWVQLAGHQGNFRLSGRGEVLKLFNEVEAKCLDLLMSDTLRLFVPQYRGLVTKKEGCFIRLEDLLSGLNRPVIMDCKMGVRTYQEEELIKAKAKAFPRTDMYQKMVKIDPSAPTAEEHAERGVTKWRYLQWRDTTTSTSTLGFRIEGIMMEDGNVQRDFRKIQTLAQVTETLLYFTKSQLEILRAYHVRLLALSDALKNSLFFKSHEVIGSSLLFVHDHSSMASVWMIDFGKTTPVSGTRQLLHNVPWTEGSGEDGYLIGLTSLITALSQAVDMVAGQMQDGSTGERRDT